MGSATLDNWEIWTKDKLLAEIGARDSEGTEFLTPGNSVNLRAYEQNGYLILIDVSVESRGLGLGRKTMEVLRDYALANSLGFEVREVINRGFVEGFDWLEEVPESKGEETNGPTFVLR